MEINNIDENRFHILMSRYIKFKEHMTDANKEEIKVFDPLSKKNMEELMLIREVTKELNRNLQEDLKKASAQAEENVAAEKEKSADTAETKTSE